MSTTKNTSRIALLPPSLALFFVMVFSLLVLFPARAANMDIPLLPADYSVFESLPGDGQSKSNTRTLTFPVPQGLTPLSAPFTVVGPTYVTCLKSPEPLALVRFVTALGYPNPLPLIVFQSCKGSLAQGIGLPSVLVTGGLFIRHAENDFDELSAQISFYNNSRSEQYQHTYERSEVRIPMKIPGGTSYKGKTLQLKALLAKGSVSSNSKTELESTVDMFFMIPWGIDPFGHAEYLLIQININAKASTSDPDCIPLESSYAKLGQPPIAFVNGLRDDILSQLASGEFGLKGAVPELLYLYDFSGKYTVPPTNTLTPEALKSPLETHYITYTNFAPIVNQYDAGYTFNLPGYPDDYVKGGSDCGPTSLGMALNALNLHQEAMTVHQKTIGDGGFVNEYALKWLNGAQATKRSPAVAGILPGGKVATEFSISGGPNDSLSAAWAKVDAFITSTKQPTMFRCSLPGGGHMILLLGKGHSDQIAELYGKSGDYYVFADPASHEFGNQDFNKRISAINPKDSRIKDQTPYSSLRSAGLGDNYSGWFAMYPAEDMRTKINRRNKQKVVTGREINVLTIGVPFPDVASISVNGAAPASPAPLLRTGFSRFSYSIAADPENPVNPVNILVTDSQGRQTGVRPDGTVVNDIPNTFFAPELEEELPNDADYEEVPNGTKTIYFLGPVPGDYKVELTATNSGSYALEWNQTGALGEPLAASTDFGDVAPGDIKTHTVTFFGSATVSDPRLGVALEGGSVAISWPATTQGLSLQSSDSLGVTATWTPVTTAAIVVGDFNVVRVPPSGRNQFFRLGN